MSFVICLSYIIVSIRHILSPSLNELNQIIFYIELIHLGLITSKKNLTLKVQKMNLTQISNTLVVIMFNYKFTVKKQ